MIATRDSRVFSIPPQAPFLPTLVDALLDGTLIDGFEPANDPLALADVTIWLPTRRAVRALASEFVIRAEGRAALLPQIHALGDAQDDAERFLTGVSTEPDFPNRMAADPMMRLFALSRLTEAWAQSLKPKHRSLLGGADVIVPSSKADAVRFARRLEQLMDTVATEEADWNKLNGLVPQDHADWWQLTLEFLKIASSAWPGILEETGQDDPAIRRVQNLRDQAGHYRALDAERRLVGPVIAAGSTGSIPATAELLTTISRLSCGAVVLPGLDRDLEEEVWRKIDLPDNDRDDSGPAATHPQFGLKRLLDQFQIDRSLVHHLGAAPGSSSGRKRSRELLVSEAMRPADAASHWYDGAPLPDHLQTLGQAERAKALNGVAIVEAPGDVEEALAIALALRETLEKPDATAALVTPNRILARRVASELNRFGIAVDDSAGQPLRNLPAGSLASLAIACGFADPSHATLMSLLQHPLTCLGRDRATVLRGAAVLELALLRGSTVPIQIADLSDALRKKRETIESCNVARLSTHVKRLDDDDWSAAFWLAKRLGETFSNRAEGNQTAANFAAASVRLVETCAISEDGKLGRLYATESGKDLNALLAQLLDHGDAMVCTVDEWPSLFDALMDGRTVRPTGGKHPRLSILGPIEARLQDFDRVVLGGLNEGSWPDTARNDAFLSRPMKLALGLPTPERRIGLAAHDVQMLLGMDDVVLTRSKRQDNAPSVASRWLQRLVLVAGDAASTSMRKAGQRFLDWVEQLDRGERPAQACARPQPKPTLDLRPKRLSFTEIETWIRDPYAIYARHVLKLQALKPLIVRAGVRERGTLYHAIMEDVADLAADHLSPETIRAIAEARFEAAGLPADVAALWWPRFEALVEPIAQWQSQQLACAEQVLVEQSGSTQSELEDFTLTGRADRIDILKDGSAQIIDYKTGSEPSSKQVETLLAPQLPLEAAMLQRGGFSDIGAADVAALFYIRLRASGEFKSEPIPKNENEVTIDEIVNTAWRELQDLIASYRDPARGYASKLHPWMERHPSDYDHLARVREWSIAQDADGDGDLA
ncbi:MAG: double-strand break repair protein AddB [Ahrensia sp.]|nr:double-strand break repair protein AddB [Ahrensia sp.]